MQEMTPLIFSLMIGQVMGFLTGVLHFLKELFISTIEISPNVDYYKYTTEFLKNQYLLSANRITILKGVQFNIYGREHVADNNNICELSNGNHYFWYKNRIIWVYITNNANIVINAPLSTIKFIKDLHQTIKNNYYANNDKLRVNMYAGDYMPNPWELRLIDKRSIDNIYLPSSIIDDIINDCIWFKNNADWYKSKGILYHRGYLFHGLPGTGKTSLVQIIAGKFDIPLYILSVLAINARTISTFVRSIPANSIVLLEDIDRVFKKKTEESSTMVDALSGLAGEKGNNVNESFRYILQILDGLFTPNGTIFILTTNNIDSLEPVLLRSGRVDRKYEFTYATEDQARAIFKQFFPDEWDLADDFALNIANKQLVMADIQEHLIRNANDAIAAAQYE